MAHYWFTMKLDSTTEHKVIPRCPNCNETFDYTWTSIFKPRDYYCPTCNITSHIEVYKVVIPENERCLRFFQCSNCFYEWKIWQKYLKEELEKYKETHFCKKCKSEDNRGKMSGRYYVPNGCLLIWNEQEI